MSLVPRSGRERGMTLLEKLSEQTQKAVQNTLMDAKTTDRPVANSLLNMSTGCGHSGLEEEEPLQG